MFLRKAEAEAKLFTFKLASRVVPPVFLSLNMLMPSLYFTAATLPRTLGDVKELKAPLLFLKANINKRTHLRLMWHSATRRNFVLIEVNLKAKKSFDDVMS